MQNMSCLEEKNIFNIIFSAQEYTANLFSTRYCLHATKGCNSLHEFERLNLVEFELESSVVCDPQSCMCMMASV